MTRKFAIAVAAAFGLLVPSLQADSSDIVVMDSYARASSPSAKTGAAFMVLMNHSQEDDVLLDVRSDIAQRVELHTHKEKDGVVRMLKVEDGFKIPAGGSHALARGGDHVMFMGLNESLVNGDTVEVTFVFEKAGEVTVDIPVDLDRKPAGHGGHSGHNEHGDSHSNHAGHGDDKAHGEHSGH